MSNDRYYLTSDDIRQQQRINRAVAELIDPAPVVNRRRNLVGDSSGSVEKIMFRCEYSSTDGEGNEGNFIHVYDETYDGTQSGHHRAQGRVERAAGGLAHARALHQNGYRLERDYRHLAGAERADHGHVARVVEPAQDTL